MDSDKSYATRFIAENEVPELYQEDIRREAAMAIFRGSDVDEWLTFWWLEHKPAEYPTVMFFNPDKMDCIDSLENDAGLHYDVYNGFCRDDC